MDGFSVTVRIPVAWGDMDAFAHVNNARYFTWFETARLHYFRRVGLATEGRPVVGPILAHVSCDFLAPVTWPAEVEVGTRTIAVGRTSFTMEYAAQAAGRPVARGRGVIVLIDYRTGTKVPVPDDLRATLTSDPTGP